MSKPDRSLDWTTILRIDRRIPLDRLRPALKPIGPRLFQMKGDVFVLASDEDEFEGAMVILSFFWAPSRGAAIRAALRDLSADDGAIGEPPEELLQARGLVTYGGILDWAKRNAPSRHFETYICATPDGGPGVSRIITVHQFTYYFRPGKVARVGHTEKFYAAEFDPLGDDPDLWQPLG